MVKPEIMFAVITGDIVGSTAHQGADDARLFSEIELNLSRAFGYMKEKAWLDDGDFVSFRGDSFQFLLPAEHGMEAALMIKAALKGGVASDPEAGPFLSWSCRLVIGIGEVTYRADQISKSNGPAFQMSGRTLDALPKDHFFEMKTGREDVNDEMYLICRYLDIVLERVWTINSARTAWVYFQNSLTQTEMAELMGISQSAVNQRIQGAEIAVLEQTIKRYKTIIKQYDS